MRILFVHQNIQGSDAECVESQEMVKALLEIGHRVGVLFAGSESATPPRIEGAELLRVSQRLNHRAIGRLIQRFSPDIAHIKSLWTPLHAVAGAALRSLGIPYVIEPGGHLNPYLLENRFGGRRMRPHQRLARMAYQRLVDLPLCRKAAGLRALSQWEADSLQPVLNIPVRIIPLGINEEWISEPGPPNPRGAPLRVNYLGRLDISQKGLDLVLDALALLSDQGFRELITVRIAGPDLAGSAQSLRDVIQDRALNAVVEGPHFGEAKTEFFRQTDLFLHLSRLEEMAKLAREAIAAGVPVLASRESNFGDWVEQEGSGFVAELNPNAIAQPLIACIKNPDLLARARVSAVRHSRKYSWSAVRQELTRFYEDLTGR